MYTQLRYVITSEGHRIEPFVERLVKLVVG